MSLRFTQNWAESDVFIKTEIRRLTCFFCFLMKKQMTILIEIAQPSAFDHRMHASNPGPNHAANSGQGTGGVGDWYIIDIGINQFPSTSHFLS